jgi:hypothetical protein
MALNSTTALDIAQSSPYPISAGGDGLMFAASLFAVTCITCLLLTRGIATSRQLWIDRHRTDRKDVMWFRATILMICIAGLISRAPDMVYKIAWGEVSTTTLHTILTIKEWSNSVAFFVVMGWIGIYTYFEPMWTLKLSNPINRVWGGNATHMRKFGLIIILSGMLAGAIAISKAFS